MTRIPFLKPRKRTPKLYQKTSEDGLALNQEAIKAVSALVQGKQDAVALRLVVEQILVALTLAQVAKQEGKQETCKTALGALYWLYKDLADNFEMSMDKWQGISCVLALREGQELLSTLPKAEFKLAYTGAHKIVLGSSKDIFNHLKLFKAFYD